MLSRKGTASVLLILRRGFGAMRTAALVALVVVEGPVEPLGTRLVRMPKVSGRMRRRARSRRTPTCRIRSVEQPQADHRSERHG